MARSLRNEERALWAKVAATVRPLTRSARAPAPPAAEEKLRAEAVTAAPVRGAPVSRPSSRGPGETLDGGWDRRLARGIVSPDVTIDLHGHSLATAHDLLDRRLDAAIAAGARLVLLVTGKPPRDDRRPVARGAIRAAVGDWLQASRHAPHIAAVRGAHPRHGGQGALYIVLRRDRARHR